jgi:GT2 family glycosyltransferase
MDAKSNMKRIINIVTCYQNELEIIEYAEELNKQQHASDICLVVVMNKQSNIEFKEFKDTLISKRSNTLVFVPNNNLGYLNGLIFGYECYIKDHEKPDWIIMSNTDIKYSGTQFFEDFKNKNYDTNIWCVAPSVYSPENDKYENPQYLKRHTLKSINKRIFIFKHPKLAYLYLKMSEMKSKKAKKKKDNSQYVYSAHGCYFILNNEMAATLMEKPYGVLMYSEEAYIAEIILKNNKKCYYDNSIEVIHEGSTVTSKLNIKKKSKYFADSLNYIRKEFY